MGRRCDRAENQRQLAGAVPAPDPLAPQPELIDLLLGCPSLSEPLAKNLIELKQLKRVSLA